MKAAGIHVSGSNAPRSAIVIMSGSVLAAPLEVSAFYERIGSAGRLFSDERIVGILQHEAPLDAVFVDCPLTVPPCVACERPVCPGVIACEDVSVAYMLSMTEDLKRAGARKKRPINPQSQRLWDIAYQAEVEMGIEPSYSANLAPLVIRARTLQKRLNAIDPEMRLQETSVPLAIELLCEHLRLGIEDRNAYRSFERGKKVRKDIVAALIKQHWLSNHPHYAEHLEAITESIDAFHAFIAAFAAQLHLSTLATERPRHFPIIDGWVHLPMFSQNFRVDC